MTAANYLKVEKNFKEYCNKVINDVETVIVTRDDGENVVLISESEYNNMLENIYVRSNHEDYQELLKSIEQLKKGQGTERELINE